MVEIQEVTTGVGNQQVEKEEPVEDITSLMALLVSATTGVELSATPVSSTVGKKTLDGSHVAEVSPPSPALTFQVVSRAPPPLATPLEKDRAGRNDKRR